MDTLKRWTYTAVIPTAIYNEPCLFHLSENGRWVVSASVKDRQLTVLVRTYAKDAPLTLTADLTKYTSVSADKSSDSAVVELIWLGYRLELWINGIMAEEEWPLGESFTQNDPVIRCASCMISHNWIPDAAQKPFNPRPIKDILFWAPDLGNENVGDCMPFSDGERYHLFYLKDRHSHTSKWGKGAHQFAHISTKDLINWEEHPMAIEITHPWEGSICTGSILKANDKYYAFYAARMMDETAAQLSWAVSDDGIHFTKSEQYFALTAPYETTSARDPEVFWGADGLYHMLVTTNLADCEIPERSGCLAHLVSSDLKNWEQKDPFIVPGYTDQPECSDYFEWNGWYYLIFSNYGLAKYRYSSSPFGPWITPANETIGGPLYRVPKTAEFAGRRIAAGFLATAVNGESYAGSVVFYELLQNEDGTLRFAHVNELIPETTGYYSAAVQSSAANAYSQTHLCDGSRYLNLKIESSGSSCGLLLTTASGKYEIRLNAADRSVSLCPAHAALHNYSNIMRTLVNTDGLDCPCTLSVFWKKGVLDLCLNDRYTLCCRLESQEMAAADTVQPVWDCYVKDGKADFKACTADNF